MAKKGSGQRAGRSVERLGLHGMRRRMIWSDGQRVARDKRTEEAKGRTCSMSEYWSDFKALGDGDCTVNKLAAVLSEEYHEKEAIKYESQGLKIAWIACIE